MIFINRYIETLKEVEKLIIKYSKYDHLDAINLIKKNTNIYKYSKGGLNRRYGLYEYSIIDRYCICNAPFGHEIKKPDKGFNYKYYYENDKIMLIERYDANKLLESNIFLYFDSTFIILCFDRRNELIHIDKYEIDNEERITRRLDIKLCIFFGADYKEEIYNYDTTGKTQIVDYRYSNSLKVWGRIFVEKFAHVYYDDKLELIDDEYKLLIFEDEEFIKKKGLTREAWEPSEKVIVKKISDYIGD